MPVKALVYPGHGISRSSQSHSIGLDWFCYVETAKKNPQDYKTSPVEYDYLQLDIQFDGMIFSKLSFKMISKEIRFT